MILRPRGSTFGVGFRRARSMRLCHMRQCWRQQRLALQGCTSVQSLMAIFGVGFRHARSMRLCATCFYAGVNSVSRCRAALLCSHWLSSASAFATPARCDASSCFYAGVNRISFCRAALHSSHWISGFGFAPSPTRLMWR